MTSSFAVLREHLARQPGGLGFVFAVGDQLVFAGTNFLVAVTLANALPPDEYGAFGVASSVLLLIGLCHTAVITEPTLIFGAEEYRNGLREYVGMVLVGHFALTVAVGFILSAGGMVSVSLGSESVGQVMISLGLALPFILLLWLLRRVFYIDDRSLMSFVGGGLYFVVVVACLAALHATGHLGPITAFLPMAVGSLCAGLLLVTWWRPVWGSTGDVRRGAVLASHWRYGRWSLLGGLVNWAPANAYFLVLPLFASLGETALLTVALALQMVLVHVISAISMNALPRVSQAYGTGRAHHMRQLERSLVIGTATLAALFSIAALIAGKSFIGLAFGSHYANSGVEYLIAASAWPVALGLVYQTLLRGVREPRQILVAYTLAAMTTVIVGFPLAAKFGATGALVGLVLSATAALLCMVRRFHQVAYGRVGDR